MRARIQPLLPAEHRRRPTPHASWAHAALPGAVVVDVPLAKHRFDRHVHDTYSLGVTLQGVQVFNCRGSLHANTPGRVIAFNPDEAHDGQPGASGGFAYRIVHVRPHALESICAGGAAPHFRESTFDDTPLARLFLAATAPAQAQESLKAEHLLQAFLLCAVRRHGRAKATAPGAGCDVRARRMRDYLREFHASDVSTADLARVAGVSRIHANRLFVQAYGIAPHAYLNALRVLQVQRLIAAGEPLAQIACSAGFADQSHMSRRFTAAVGVSPDRYRRMLAPPGAER